MDKLVVLLLQKLKINHPKEELSFQIQSHPSYPSLHAITGVLTHFNIENIALQVPVNEETLAQLPKHFIAQLQTEQGENFAVVSNDGLYYKAIFTDMKKSTYPIDEFLKKFTGIMVAAEKDENHVETKANTDWLLKALVGITLLVLSSIWLLAMPGISISLFLLASLLGIYISFSIYKQEQGEKTGLSEAFCSGESKKTDCNSVINSKGANLFGIFKLSDLSLVYFTGLATLTYLTGITNLSQSYPYLIAIAAVSITIYSLYYQAFVVKAWCGLCLSIVGILWIQAVIVLRNVTTLTAFSFDTKEIFLSLLSFSLVATAWFYLKPILANTKELKKEKIKYFKFKRNFKLFNTLLQQSESIDTAIPETSEIVFGSQKNSLPIVIVTNPFCGHCRAVHTLVEAIYKKYKDKTRITIRFNINATDKESDVVKITGRIIELYHKEGQESAMQALHAIYGGQKPTHWLQEWGICTEPETYGSVLEKESAWCKQNNINFTPEILIDGKAFPKEYDRSDLQFFIEELHENYMEKMEKISISNKLKSVEAQ